MHLRLSFSILSLLAIFLFSGCEKRLIDYRNKYTGDFQVEYSYYYWNISQGVTEADTLNFVGNVSYDKKGERKSIIVKFGEKELDLEVEKNGSLLMCGNGVGEFTDEKHFTLNYSSHTCENAGHGGGAGYKVIGTR